MQFGVLTALAHLAGVLIADIVIYHVFWEVLEFQFSVRLMVLLMTKQLEKTNSVEKFSAAFGNYLKFI
jgi:hypothetical protein